MQSNGVALDGVTVTSSGQGIGVFADNNITIRNLTATTRNSGIAIWSWTGSVPHVGPYLIDSVTITMTGPHSFITVNDDKTPSCKTQTTSRNLRNVTIRNSVFTSAGGDEGLWAPCIQNLLIEGNTFVASPSGWKVSTPDSLDVTIRNNVFGVGQSFTAIEFPRTFRALVTGNSFTGPANSAVWLNSGSDFITVTDNTCVNLPLLNGTAAVLRQVNNAGCGITPPATGSGGLR